MHSNFLVLLMQLGILDQERVLQRELDTIGEAADTSTSQGLDQIMMVPSNSIVLGVNVL